MVKISQSRGIMPININPISIKVRRKHTIQLIISQIDHEIWLFTITFAAEPNSGSSSLQTSHKTKGIKILNPGMLRQESDAKAEIAVSTTFEFVFIFFI